MEWYLWVIIFASILVVGFIFFSLLAGDDEEKNEAQEQPEIIPEHNVIDLDNEDSLAALTEKHLQLYLNYPTTLSVKDKGLQGYSWAIHEKTGCEQLINIEPVILLDQAKYFSQLQS